MGAASINGLEMEVISIDQSGGNTFSQNLWAELAIMSSKISINQAQVQTRTGRVGESESNWEREQQKQANLAAHCDRQQMSSGPHGRADTGGEGEEQGQERGDR